uniref:Lipoxygenase domain-containing protein n=1 Tax=Salix viminalis TaxID=40686 RepID=A0A6N2KJ99_SALVM
MPTEAPSDEELKLFLMKPGFALLKCFPSQIQATKVMAVSSSHSPDEECIETGTGAVPCELLKPFTGAGVTGKGVPDSISI